MEDKFESYQSIKEWHDTNLLLYKKSIEKLQWFHETIFVSAFDITLKEMIKEHGSPPCPFSWFVMGSAGRNEQSVVSDQDHGIIYKESGSLQNFYFLTFGKKLTEALEFIGYPQCEGNVMSSNPLWCQSEKDWRTQITKWIEENTWKSLRYLLIFMDARAVVGDKEKVLELKKIVYQRIEEKPFLLERLLENTKFNVNAIGVFNQFLPIETGPYTGYINLKSTAFFPYVNAIRLLSMMENIDETSTLGRMKALSLCNPYKEFMHLHHENFSKLLQYRLLNMDVKNYEDSHYLNLKKLNKLEKQNLKQIYKDIKRLQKFTELKVQGVINHER